MRLSEHTKESTPYRSPERVGGPPHSEPSATEADALTERVTRGVLIIVPGLFAFGGWWVLMAAVVTHLTAYFTPAVSLTIVGGAHVVLGGGIALWALKHPWSSGVHNSAGVRP